MTCPGPASVPMKKLSVNVRLKGPFDLALSLAAAACFLPAQGVVPVVLRVGVRLGRHPAILEIRQIKRSPPMIVAFSTIANRSRRLQEQIEWLISSDLDLRQFYELVHNHPIMGPVTRSLKGLKPLRPLSLFEMVIIAITEQQLSLAAAFYIRGRLVARFGQQWGTVWIFPAPETLADAPLGALMRCGLSARKAKYIKDLARRVADCTFDLDALKHRGDEEAYACLVNQRGLGAWSAQYILARGLGRHDRLPSDDVSLRRVVGGFLSRGRHLTPEELEEVLVPFAPFRGLAAFYLSVAARLHGFSSLEVQRSAAKEPSD
jgi:3-methyladenine DNA glycosylase/8-oxoguanine DNA glycosylase